MDKKVVLKTTIFINMFLFFICLFSFFAYNDNSSYLNYGWSRSFHFVSISIDTPVKYFSLCSFIVGFNVCEVFLNEFANPLIVFSTYNPYKKTIQDFTRLELELYSNIIFFIQVFKQLLAIISLVSSQGAALLVINILLNDKTFVNQNTYIEVPNYNSFGDTRLSRVNI